MKLAALVLIIAACSGGSNQLSPDGSSPMTDGNPDGPDEAQRVEVTVEPLNFGTLDPTIVVFYDDTDAVVSHGAVDAGGHAHGYLPLGGSVTALRSSLAGHRTISLVNIRHIQPGDQLTFDISSQEEVHTGAEDVMTATYTPPASGGDFAVYRPCGQTGLINNQPNAPLLLHFFESCTTTTFDMLLVSTGAPRQFLWMPDIPYSGGGNFTVPNSWQPTGTLEATFTNLPTAPAQIAAFVSLLVGPMRVAMNTGTFQLSSSSPSFSTPAWPTGGGPGTTLLAYLGPTTHPDARMVVDPSAGSTITMDTTALPLPTFPDDELPTQTVEGASWNQSGTPAGDLRQVTWAARYVGANQIQNDFFVNVFDDPTTPTTMHILPLPDDYADRDPTKVLPVALELVGTVVNYIDYGNLAGYADARMHAMRYSTVENSYMNGATTAHSTTSRSFFRP